MRGKSISRAVLTTDGHVLLAQPDGSYRPMEGQTDWKRVRNMSDAEAEAIATADPGTLPASFWEKAQPVAPQTKEKVSARFDADVVEWFRRQGRGYQTRMNAVLRAYVKAASNATGRKK
jgi:uncharacterized protein (DUF4415 family)